MFSIEDELKKLPGKPGVYLMKDINDNIIYVGKAISLKNRVRQYFQSSKNHSIKIRKMVKNIASFEYIVTRTEVEALVLECNLIKKYDPKYNIRLKDDKTYPYIKIDVTNDFPRVQVVRRMKKDGEKYFGPYTNSTAMWEIVDLIKDTWQLRTCQRVLPRDIGKQRACLNYHIGKCHAPCEGKISSEDYKVMIDEILGFLSGKYQDVIAGLTEKMNAASENMEYEKAAGYRDKIIAISKLEQKQQATLSSMLDQDIIAFAKSPEDTLVQVYFVRDGKMVGREHFYFKGTEGEKIEDIFRDFIVQFYANAAFLPKEIVIEREPTEKKVLEEYLKEKRGSKVSIITPQKGDKHGLLELASKNADITLSQFGDHIKKEQERTIGATREIATAINLDSDLKRIEAYDISNTQGVQSVAGMVVFENGKPKKSDYRKFKIESIVGPNDYGSMEEVLTRRFARIDNEGTSFSKIPDLILMDGGKGQVTVAKRVMEKYGLNIPICGMVKDDKHRTRGLLYENQEVYMPTNGEGFKLITRIQDEVHRFSIEYHRQLRGQAQIRSVLDDIKGIGAMRKKELMRHFGSIDKIKEASFEELAQVDRMNLTSAEAVYEFFHANNTDNNC